MVMQSIENETLKSRKAIETLCPPISFYENVRSASHRMKGNDGNLEKPCVEASLPARPQIKKVHIHIYCIHV